MNKKVIYAMAGPIGSGKTEFARRLADRLGAPMFSVDATCSVLRHPISTIEDYNAIYPEARELVTELAKDALREGYSVVFDFGGTKGHWEWLNSLATEFGAKVEIFHFQVPKSIRLDRVRKRNLDPTSIFKFTDAEFEAMPQESEVPALGADLVVHIVDENGLTN